MKLDFKGVYFGRYALCDAIYTYSKAILKFSVENKKNSLEKTVLKMGSQKFTIKY